MRTRQKHTKYTKALFAPGCGIFLMLKPGGPYSNHWNLKGKGKVYPFRAKKAYKGSRGIAPCILDIEIYAFALD